MLRIRRGISFILMVYINCCFYKRLIIRLWKDEEQLLGLY